ncbi:hypothetical protein HYS97_01355 [Candidatus Daviesbacteria bacterium]|nr:hypothetical protein [Candidatus Daviesbacteria bacterium]
MLIEAQESVVTTDEMRKVRGRLLIGSTRVLTVARAETLDRVPLEAHAYWATDLPIPLALGCIARFYQRLGSYKFPTTTIPETEHGVWVNPGMLYLSANPGSVTPDVVNLFRQPTELEFGAQISETSGLDWVILTDGYCYVSYLDLLDPDKSNHRGKIDLITKLNLGGLVADLFAQTMPQELPEEAIEDATDWLIGRFGQLPDPGVNLSENL